MSSIEINRDFLPENPESKITKQVLEAQDRSLNPESRILDPSEGRLEKAKLRPENPLSEIRSGFIIDNERILGPDGEDPTGVHDMPALRVPGGESCRVQYALSLIN